MRIVVTGGTGFIGHALVAELTRQGHDVVVFCRQPRRSAAPAIRYVEWDAQSQGPWRDEVHLADAVVNLAGAPIAEGRWTPARKRLLVESRTVTTKLLVDALAQRPSPLPVLISASGIGYYGASDDRLLDERSALGEGFLADLSAAWEAEALRAGQFGTRVVVLRTGMVLGPDGGAFPLLKRVFGFGLGGRLGSGRQWMPWIHVEDAVGLILRAVEQDSIRGPINLTAPEAVTNAIFTQTLATTLHRPAFFHAPAFAMRLLLRGMADEMLLGSQRVNPRVATDSGYTFAHPNLAGALASLLNQESGIRNLKSGISSWPRNKPPSASSTITTRR